MVMFRIVTAALLLSLSSNLVQLVWNRIQVKRHEVRLAQVERERDSLAVEVRKLRAEAAYLAETRRAKEALDEIEKRIDEAVGRGDAAALRQLFRDHGMLRPDGDR